MHLAFLGVCPESVDLARAAGSLGHRLTWFLPDERPSDEIAGVGGKMQPFGQWETLLDAPDIDGIVLASAVPEEVELRSDQWRRLAQAGTRLLVVHPIVPALLVYLEVDMLARESGAVIVPYWRAAYSLAAGKVQVLASGVDYGFGQAAMEQVIVRRHLHDRTPENVTRWFARDAALLDLLSGPFEEIGAMGPDTTDTTYATLAVHLNGSRGIPVRWEVARVQDEEHGVLVATGPDTEMEIEFPEPVVDPSAEPSSEALAAIESFEDLVHAGTPQVEGWQRCVRAMELADSIEISLRRGRRVEVHYRPMTEETSYKGMMSAVGCGLLVLALITLVFAGMLHAVFGWKLMRFWYVPVLVIFVAFLALQLLARLAARSHRNPPPEPTSRESGDTA